MTLNRASYPALKNEFEFQKMRLVEKNLSRKVFHIIGKDKVSRQKTKIKNGDIIAFTTKMKVWMWRMSALLYGRERICIFCTPQAKKAWLFRKKLLWLI